MMSVICSLFIISSFFLHIQIATGAGNVIFSYWEDHTKVQERQREDVYVNISLADGAREAHLVLFSPDESAYRIVNGSSVRLSVEELGDNGVLVHKFTVKGIKLSVTQVYVTGTIDEIPFVEYYTDYLIKVLVWSPPYKELVDYFLLAWVSVTYVTMGVKIDIKLVWGRLKRPWPVFIGFLCQFFLMPITAFCLAKLLKLDAFTAIGLIVDGAAPGGWASNILSILLGLDFVLSLTMTSCSTFLAIATMPMNLWIFGTPFLDEEVGAVVLPFKILVMQLGLLLIPVLTGMAIGYFWPKVGKYLEKALRPLAITLILLAIGLGVPVKYYAFLVGWQTYLAALLLPLVGGGLGFLISLICRLPLKQAGTVALETGLQNALLATSMLALAFGPPEKDLMARVPLMISILSMAQCFLVYLIKVIVDIVFDNATDKKRPDAAANYDEELPGGVEMREVNDNQAFDYYENPAMKPSVLTLSISTQTEDKDGKPHALEYY